MKLLVLLSHFEKKTFIIFFFTFSLIINSLIPIPSISVWGIGEVHILGIEDAEAGLGIKKLKRKAKKHVVKPVENIVEAVVDTTFTVLKQKAQDDYKKVNDKYQLLLNKKNQLNNKITSINTAGFLGLFNIPLKNEKLGPINLFLANPLSEHYSEATQHAHESISLGALLSAYYDDVEESIEDALYIQTLFNTHIGNAGSSLSNAGNSLANFNVTQALNQIHSAAQELQNALSEEPYVLDVLNIDIPGIEDAINAAVDEFLSEVNKFSAALGAAVLRAANQIDGLLASRDKVQSTMQGITEHNLPEQLVPSSLMGNEATINAYLESDNSGGNEHSNPIEEVNRKTRAFAQAAKDIMARMRSESNAIASDLLEMQATLGCMSEKLGKANNRTLEAQELIQKHKFNRVPNKLDSALYYIDRTMKICGAFKKFKDLNVTSMVGKVEALLNQYTSAIEQFIGQQAAAAYYFAQANTLAGYKRSYDFFGGLISAIENQLEDLQPTPVMNNEYAALTGFLEKNTDLDDYPVIKSCASGITEAWSNIASNVAQVNADLTLIKQVYNDLEEPITAVTTGYAKAYAHLLKGEFGQAQSSINGVSSSLLSIPSHLQKISSFQNFEASSLAAVGQAFVAKYQTYWGCFVDAFKVVKNELLKKLETAYQKTIGQMDYDGYRQLSGGYAQDIGNATINISKTLAKGATQLAEIGFNSTGLSVFINQINELESKKDNGSSDNNNQNTPVKNQLGATAGPTPGQAPEPESEPESGSTKDNGFADIDNSFTDISNKATKVANELYSWEACQTEILALEDTFNTNLAAVTGHYDSVVEQIEAITSLYQTYYTLLGKTAYHLLKDGSFNLKRTKQDVNSMVADLSSFAENQLALYLGELGRAVSNASAVYSITTRCNPMHTSLFAAITAFSDALNLPIAGWLRQMDKVMTDADEYYAQVEAIVMDFFEQMAQLFTEPPKAFTQAANTLATELEDCAECLQPYLDMGLDVSFPTPTMPNLGDLIGISNLNDLKKEFMGIITGLFNGVMKACNKKPDNSSVGSFFGSYYECINTFVDIESYYDIFMTVIDLIKAGDLEGMLAALGLSQDVLDELLGYIQTLKTVIDMPNLLMDFIQMLEFENIFEKVPEIAMAYSRSLFDHKIDFRDLLDVNAPMQCLINKVANKARGHEANMDGYHADSRIELDNLARLEDSAERPYRDARYESCMNYPIGLHCLPFDLTDVPEGEEGEFMYRMVAQGGNLNPLIIDAWHNPSDPEDDAETAAAQQAQRDKALHLWEVLLTHALGSAGRARVDEALALNGGTFQDTVVTGIGNYITNHPQRYEPLIVDSKQIAGRQCAYIRSNHDPEQGRIFISKDLMVDYEQETEEDEDLIDTALSGMASCYLEELGHMLVDDVQYLAGIPLSDWQQAGDAGARFAGALQAFNSYDDVATIIAALADLPSYADWDGGLHVDFKEGTAGTLYNYSFGRLLLDGLPAMSIEGTDDSFVGFIVPPTLAYRTTIGMGLESSDDLDKQYKDINDEYEIKNTKFTDIVNYAQDALNRIDLNYFYKSQRFFPERNITTTLIDLKNLRRRGKVLENMYHNKLSTPDSELFRIIFGNTNRHIDYVITTLRNYSLHPQQPGFVKLRKNFTDDSIQQFKNLETQFQNDIANAREEIMTSYNNFLRNTPEAKKLKKENALELYQELIFDLLFTPIQTMGCKRFYIENSDRMNRANKNKFTRRGLVIENEGEENEKVKSEDCDKVAFFDFEVALLWESKPIEAFLEETSAEKMRMLLEHDHPHIKWYNKLFNTISLFPKKEYKKTFRYFQVFGKDKSKFKSAKVLDAGRSDWHLLRDPTWKSANLIVAGVQPNLTTLKRRSEDDRSKSKFHIIKSSIESLSVLPLLWVEFSTQIKQGTENRTVDDLFADKVIKIDVPALGGGAIVGFVALLLYEFFTEKPVNNLESLGKTVAKVLSDIFTTDKGRKKLFYTATMAAHIASMATTIGLGASNNEQIEGSVAAEFWTMLTAKTGINQAEWLYKLFSSRTGVEIPRVLSKSKFSTNTGLILEGGFEVPFQEEEEEEEEKEEEKKKNKV